METGLKCCVAVWLETDPKVCKTLLEMWRLVMQKNSPRHGLAGSFVCRLMFFCCLGIIIYRIFEWFEGDVAPCVWWFCWFSRCSPGTPTCCWTCRTSSIVGAPETTDSWPRGGNRWYLKMAEPSNIQSSIKMGQWVNDDCYFKLDILLSVVVN